MVHRTVTEQLPEGCFRMEKLLQNEGVSEPHGERTPGASRASMHPVIRRQRRSMPERPPMLT